jgi:hypothetical protein
LLLLLLALFWLDLPTVSLPPQQQLLLPLPPQPPPTVSKCALPSTASARVGRLVRAELVASKEPSATPVNRALKRLGRVGVDVPPQVASTVCAVPATCPNAPKGLPIDQSRRERRWSSFES